MPDSNLKILLVDDDPVLVEMHSVLLEKNNYSVLTAEDGERAVRILQKFHANIGVVVTDISMPGMDGYRLCEWLKSTQQTKNIPVIFVSALSGLEEKIKGYAAGADDYIPKPVSEDELAKKIGILLEIRHKQDLFSKGIAESHNKAMQAMTFSNELAQVIEFYSGVLNAADYKQVAKRYFELAAGFDLLSVMQIYGPGQVLSLGENGIVSPLEVNMLELARDKGRFFDFGARTIVNYRSFSLLVKNMPLADAEKYRRLKEILLMAGNVLEVKIHQLNTELLAEHKYSLGSSIKESINNIEILLADMQKGNAGAIKAMRDQVLETGMAMGLTDEQKMKLEHIISVCLERSNMVFHKVMDVDLNLKNIYQQFNLAIGAKT